MSTRGDVPHALTLHVRDTCLCLHVRRAARALSRRIDEALRPVGLTNGQFSLLMALNRPDPPTIGAVADVLAMDRTTLTAALKPLERDGLLVVTSDPDDRRTRRLSLTDAGRALLTRAARTWQATHAALDQALADSGGGDLRAGLRLVSDLLRA